jgi:hypothetical protein
MKLAGLVDPCIVSLRRELGWFSQNKWVALDSEDSPWRWWKSCKYDWKIAVLQRVVLWKLLRLNTMTIRVHCLLAIYKGMSYSLILSYTVPCVVHRGTLWDSLGHTWHVPWWRSAKPVGSRALRGGVIHWLLWMAFLCKPALDWILLFPHT